MFVRSAVSMHVFTKGFQHSPPCPNSHFSRSISWMMNGRLHATHPAVLSVTDILTDFRNMLTTLPAAVGLDRLFQLGTASKALFRSDAPWLARTLHELSS